MICVVEFGSTGRGDHDIWSDRDVLVIGGDGSAVRRLSESERRRGSSVKTLTWGQARYFTRQGSLFLKHVFDEGRVVGREPDEYRRVVELWRPARSYYPEIEATLDLFELLRFMPRSAQGLAAASDLAVTSARSILIRRLANEGEYLFSWERILRAGKDRRWLSSSDVKVLQMARRAKNAYRHRGRCVLGESDVRDVIGSAARGIGTAERPQFATRRAVDTLPDRCTSGTYKQLRALEFLRAERPFDAGLDVIAKWIRTPSHFCSQQLSY